MAQTSRLPFLLLHATDNIIRGTWTRILPCARVDRRARPMLRLKPLAAGALLVSDTDAPLIENNVTPNRKIVDFTISNNSRS